MQYVEVLVDLPLQVHDSVFTYHILPPIDSQAELGRRVLVPLGGRKAEGIIINVDAPAWPGSQSVLKVLDESAVIDVQALELSRWIAEYYCCTWYTAIKAMIPRRLGKKTGRGVISLLGADAVNELAASGFHPDMVDFMAELMERGEIPYKEARARLEDDKISLLESQGIIHISGSYAGYRATRNHGQYILGDYRPDVDGEILRKKAPRQAEAMDLIMAQGSVDKSWLTRKIPADSIKSLLAKGYIKVESKVRDNSRQDYALSPSQQEAMDRIEESLERGEKAEYLLYGITGSGKTEVYIHAIKSTLQRGKSALLLIPEIALTRHLVEIFLARIPDLAVIHSRMTPGERHDEWKRIRSGEAKLVLGTRSAVFAPLVDPGLIIIDEEQEHSYKQQEPPRYHAREVARKLAVQHSAVLLLGSATPSFETFHRAKVGEIGLLKMPERIGVAELPEVFITDMRKAKNGVISPLLREKIGQMLARGEQTILFQNRRGFAPLTICLDCGHIPGCPRCSVALTYHRNPEREICHYCDYQIPMLSACPECGSNRLQHMGTGTQKVEAEARELFPQARIARLDLDSSQHKDAQPRILDGMKNGDIDILIGTQMVARGLDFPGVSLVGIMDVDNMLNLPDFRAAERCFQLVVQAAGRAGRRDKTGQVVIQTFNPEHPVVQMAIRQDFEGFFREEIRQRRCLDYPPFTHILRIVLVGAEEQAVRRCADEISHEIMELGDAKEDEFIILGPAPCPISYINNCFRYQLMVKCDNILLLSSMGKALLTRGIRPGIKLQVEIDPLNSM
ncbi:MAG: primosomal protein N' [Syntrophomonadaceae bacterium]|nr:primosomal protein N' [Syntrophomonadaceae bacterium]